MPQMPTYRWDLCAVAAILVGSWFLWVDLSSYNLGLVYKVDTFYAGVIGLLVFFAIGCFALIVLIRGASTGNRAAILPGAVLVLAACLAMLTRSRQQELAAYWFFLANESHFAYTVSRGTAESPVVYRRTSGSVHKLIVFVRSNRIPEGVLGASTISAIGPALLPFASCRISTQRLKGPFYLLTANC